MYFSLLLAALGCNEATNAVKLSLGASPVIHNNTSAAGSIGAQLGRLSGTAVHANPSHPATENYLLKTNGRGIKRSARSTFSAGNSIATSAVSALPADALVDSVGINVHLGFLDSPYRNFNNVRNALISMGIRHIRDGLTSNGWKGYFEEHNSLGVMGIKSVFITDVGESAALIQTYPAQMAQCFEGYEAPNEYDNRGVPGWASSLHDHLGALSSTVRGQPQSWPIYGPSLVKSASFAAVGDISKFVDFGNLHNYPGGHNPGNLGWGAPDARGHAYGSIAWQRDLLNQDAPGLPFVSTETGYTNETLRVGMAVPERVAAVYMPRLILEQWRAGAKRTYLYELVSSLGQDYGLYRSDWTKKPAALAVANLLKLLGDPGVTFNPGQFTYGLQGGDARLRQLLLEKRDRSFYLALWVEKSGYNVGTQTLTIVPPEVVRLHLPNGVQVTQHLWDGTGNMTSKSLSSVNILTVSVTDKLLILEIR